MYVVFSSQNREIESEYDANESSTGVAASESLAESDEPWEKPDPENHYLLARKYQNAVEVKFRNGVVIIKNQILEDGRASIRGKNWQTTDQKELGNIIVAYYRFCLKRIFKSLNTKTIYFTGYSNFPEYTQFWKLVSFYRW